MENELLKMKKMESLCLFAGGIAHDFNNLLSIVTGNISLAAEDLPKTSKTTVFLKNVEKACDRARELSAKLITLSIGNQPIKRVASLARLTFTDDEVQGFTGNMEQILTYVEKLDELDVEGVEPTAHVHDIVNAFREDAVRPGLPNEKALANAPSDEDGCFKVAKIIEEA